MSTITIEVPDDLRTVFTDSPEEFAKEMLLAAAIHWYGRGLISQGKGAEIAGISRVEFLDALFRAEVPACQVTAEELKEEVERALRANRERLPPDPPLQGRAD